MCGIAGIYNISSDTVDAERVCRMLAVILHRGPDHSAVLTVGPAALGYVRLSILDLSDSGNQPMSDATGNFVAVYNGEVYNFAALRKDLEHKVPFRSETDTEVVVNLFAREGIAGIQKLNGMFALAVWSRRDQELWLFRDPIGVKPLYYSLSDNELTFASELKALRAAQEDIPDLDPVGVINYLTYGHAVAPRTIHTNVFKLLPGYYLRIKGSHVQVEPYFDFPLPFHRRHIGMRQLLDECELVLDRAVQRQMVADVPVGVFLSGGIDSSLVTAFMARHTSRLKTFSVGFPGYRSYDETSDAKIVAHALGTQHYEVFVSEKELLDAVDELAYFYDEPFADVAGLPLYVLAKFARTHVKVALSGDGGDELFGGYRRYSAERFWSHYQRLPVTARSLAIKAAARFGRARRTNRLVNTLTIADAAQRYAGWLEIFSRDILRSLLCESHQEQLAAFDSASKYRPLFDNCRGAGNVQRVCYADCLTLLPDTYLEKVDKATMAVSLEARVPLLDLEVVRFAAGIPDSLRIRGFTTKYILRQLANRLLPKTIACKPKHGFEVPIDQWIRGALREYMRGILLDAGALSARLFRPGAVESLLKRHTAGQENCENQIWTLLMLELWMRRVTNRTSTVEPNSSASKLHSAVQRSVCA